jgi:signal transduction histidine kinase
VEAVNNGPARVAELEALISAIRHDVRGALATTRLITDRMRSDPEPRVQKYAARIDGTTQRILDRLEATRTVVPPRAAPGG